MIKKMSRNDRDFYKYMGPIFGSRKVQRDTGDRFYDDEGKEWIVNIDDSGEIDAVLAVKDRVLKNVYASSGSSLEKLLSHVYKDVKSGTVPAIYEQVYIAAGYRVEHGNMKKFVEVMGRSE